MKNTLAVSLLLLFSFIVITLGGYQCATNVTELPTRQVTPVSPPEPLNPSNTGLEVSQTEDKTDNSLPEDNSGSCSREEQRHLKEKFGAMAFLELDAGALEDYSLGVTHNFPIKCPRIYLSMSKMSSSRVFKGKLAISYETGGKVYSQPFITGRTESDNRYNRWTRGSWTADSNNEVDKQFHAIFEDQDGAIILKLDNVRTRDMRDEEDIYLGAGEIWYKMFRIYAGRGDHTCYSEGTYAKYAKEPIPRPRRCWLIPAGAYSCRPKGAVFTKNPPDINLKGDLPCYTRLGRFGRLEIKEAFNVDDVTDIR